ncbi:transposase [Xanthomonas sacchari]|nr:transposase [Xanthomonas sacchari]
MAVDTLGPLLAQEVQHVTGETVKRAFVDQSYTGKDPAGAALTEGIALHVVKLPEAKKGFVLLLRRWVVERSFGWVNRFRRLARDYKRLPETSAGLHFVAFTTLMLGNAASILKSS